MSCINVPPFPTLGSMSFELPDISFPTMPSPLFPDQINPDLSSLHGKTELVMGAVLALLDKIMQPVIQICNLMGGVVPILSSYLDQIVNFEVPSIGIKFTEFLNLSQDGLKSMILSLSKIAKNIKLAFLPDPFTFDQFNPVYEATVKFQVAIREASTFLLTIIVNVFKAVMDKLKSLGMGLVDLVLDIPTSLTALLSLGGFVLPAFSGISLPPIPNIDLASLFNSFTIPGLDIGFALPSVIFPKMKNFSMEFAEMMKNWMTAMLTAVMGKLQEVAQVIVDVWNALSSEAQEVVSNVISAIGGVIAAFASMVGPVEFCAV